MSTSIQLAANGLVVEDMARSLAFYRNLGLDIPAGVEDEQHVEANLPGGLRLMWDRADLARSIDPDWTAPSGSSRVALAFECASVAGVDKTYADLVALGYTGHKEPWDAPWGQRYAMVEDPDGNGVDLFCGLG